MINFIPMRKNFFWYLNLLSSIPYNGSVIAAFLNESIVEEVLINSSSSHMLKSNV